MIRTSKPRLAGLLGLGLSLTMLTAADRAARGDVSLPSIFGSHMVLQRDQKDRVWGKASPGEQVNVRIADQSKTTTADAGGKWSVTLDPLPAGGPHKLTVEGKNTVTFDDVLVGEVWVCSGQSNMQLSLAGANDADSNGTPRGSDGGRHGVWSQEKKNACDGRDRRGIQGKEMSPCSRSR